MLQPQPNGYVLYVLVKQHYFTEIFLILRVVSYLLQSQTCIQESLPTFVCRSVYVTFDPKISVQSYVSVYMQ